MTCPHPPWPDYRDFQTASARDLCWLLSPQFDLSMPASAYQPFTVDRRSTLIRWLEQLDQTPELHPPLAHADQRLGRYFEDLVAFYLSYAPGLNIHQLQRNRALRQPSALGNKGVDTLGELDFLFNRDGQLHHLEVAVKVYLAHTQDRTTEWLGPNSTDTLARKWRHLLNQQLPLGQRYFPDIDSQYWLKGLLFEHWTDAYALTPTRLHWLHANQTSAYFACYPGQWLWLKKHQWLGFGATEQQRFDAHQLPQALSTHFAKDDYGIMLVHISTHDTPKLMQERRCFVVADHWPKRP